MQGRNYMKFTLYNLSFLYVITAVVFFAIDLIWLGVIAKGFYAKHVGHLLREQVNWPAAIIFYAVYIAGIQVFVMIPALQNGWGPFHTALIGAMLGFFAYCTFDLTALALLKSWTVFVSVVDILWGTVLTGATASAALVLSGLLLKADMMP